MRNGSPTGGGKGEMADRPTFQLIFCIFGNARQAQIRLGVYKLVLNCMFDVNRYKLTFGSKIELIDPAVL